MTVKELIEELQQCDQEKEVMICAGGDLGVFSAKKITEEIYTIEIDY